jgi:hypothetical protein
LHSSAGPEYSQAMQKRARVLAVFALLTAASTVAIALTDIAAVESRVSPPQDGPALTSEQVRALVMRVLESQHRDDLARGDYEWTEHVVARGSRKDAADTETTTRVVATGISLERIELERDGKPADPAALEQQWRGAEQAILTENRPDDPRQKQNYQRAAKRRQQRAELVDAIGKAFRFQWVNRVSEGGRTLIELSVEPDPTYKSSALFAIVYAHIRGTVWIDETSNQLARLVANLGEDIYFGGGLILEVYRGGHATYQQQEVEPGIWLPTHYAYDYDGRKLLVSSLGGHKRVDAGDYRRLGPPEKALAVLQGEHAGLAGQR